MTKSRHNNKRQTMLVGTSVNARTSIGLHSYEPRPTIVRALYHPTTSLARRTLLLISFLLLGLGNAWGQDYVNINESATAKVTKQEYAKNGQLSYGLPNDAISQIIANIPDLTADNIYVRWSAWKNNERVSFKPDWNDKLYINPSNGQSYQFSIDPNGYCIYGQINVYAGSNIEEVLGAKVTIEKDNLTLDDYVIEYYISKERDQIRNSKQEPDEFDMKVELIFNEKGKKEDSFFNDDNSTATYDQLSKTITLTDEYNAATNTITLLKPNDWPNDNVQFVRWYISKADGNLLDAEEESSAWISLPAEFIKDDEGTHGWYWHSATAQSASLLQIPIVTLPEDKDFEDYRLVAVMSTDEGTTDEDNFKEPVYTLMYYFNFDFPFRGDATNAIIRKTTLKVPPSKQSDMLTLSFDYDTNTIKLMSGSEELDSTPIDNSFLEAYPTLPENFYIRWFLRKDDAEIYIENSLDGGNIYFIPYKERYYYYWSTEKDKNTKKLGDILKININASLLSELMNYALVCTIATDPIGEDYGHSDKLTHEPNTLAFEYSFHFADKFVEAENLSTVKTIHKIALYDKSTGKITPTLFISADSYNEAMSDIGAQNNNDGYMRWYITDNEGNLVSDMGEWEFSSTMKISDWDIGYQKNDTYGYYMIGGFESYNAYKYNPTFTMPEGYNKDVDYKNYQIVCIITTDKTGMDLPDKEPTNMMVKYIFNEFLFQGDIVHYKGQSGRDWIIPDVSTRTLSQLYWDNITEEAEETAIDIRQGVHTWEYDVYVRPNEERNLILPFQNYDNNGQDLEPRGYIRWYDWKTDDKVIENNFIFSKNSMQGNKLEENDRGLFGLCLSESFSQKSIGVTFTPDENFLETIDIACDVSKYSDGIVEIAGTYYLLHEPTLSTRYIFHIHPAKEIADRLMEAKQQLQSAEDSVQNNKQKLYKAMSELEEDKGKVVVSLNGTSGSFALRFDHHSLSNYILYNGSSYVSADKIQWYAYFEDDKGIWKKQITGTNDETGRITTFNYNAFTGDYYDLQGTQRPDFVNDAKEFHVVGYVVNSENSMVAPVVHYELHFISAPPKKLTEIPKERTEAYMRYYYDLAAVVDFDGNPKTNPNVVGYETEYYSTENWYDAPTSSDDNMTHMPFQWNDIQYGFCYPELNYTIKNGWCVGLSPIHGDYIVLKSMNMKGVSEAPDRQKESQPDEYHWWNDTPLYDYTHTVTDATKYGSFIYTDASDESRSIATIPFTANLCNGSSIYFTAAVADMTDGSAKPQLLIRIVGIDEKNNRKRIVAFHTCDIFSLGAGAGEWYQVYGVSTVPTDFDVSITRFEAEVINYANSTQGADFAIDQIMIYTSTAKVLLTQTGSDDCTEEANEENKVQVYMAGEGLQNAFGTEDKLLPIYWRICEEETNKVITGKEMYLRYSESGEETEDDGTFTYGITWVNPHELNEVTNTAIPEIYGWYKVGEQFFFQLANKGFSALEEGKNYYVSVYTPNPDGDFDETNAASWGNPTDICSIYSEFFIPRRQYVTYLVPESDGKEGGEITIPCGSSGAEVSGVVMVLKVPDDTQISGFRDEKISFDYILCSKNEWSSDVDLGNGISYNNLVAALKDYRETYPETEGLNDNYQHETYRETLEKAIAAKILILAASPEFTYIFSEAGTHYVTCIPISNKIGTTETEICGPFEVIFKLKSSGGPLLTLGFEDVDYSKVNGYRVVRVGLEQLNNLKSDYLLHIPVNMFKADTNGDVNDGTLVVDGDYLELLPNTGSYLTDDANVTSGNKNVAKFEETIISKEKMYISLNFHETNVIEQVFHEGFTYHMFFQVKKQGASATDCEANVNFLLKVVPKYVTWNDEGTGVTPNNNQNTNWNNDTNWSRSKKAELHKTGTNNYDDNTDMGINSTPATFVPMKFTYVTIPSDNVAPNLINLETTNGIYNNIGSDATSNIQYDLMVRYTEESCIDHGVTPNTNIYDCEKFYGNWAKEIYFKPRAELVNQHYLTYEKVWVEKELTANTWTLMSTPLQNTYAGDMYVPAVNGRQETEAFTDINFGEGYSRTLYPIYQKSWKQEGSKVYTMTNDVRANSYNAELKGSVNTTLSLWSHTYNDVQVNYSQWKGFAIRAHKQTKETDALLRLPKEDTKYDYYKWDGTSQEPAAGDEVKKVEKTTTGKLFTDGTANIIGLTYGVKYGETQGRTAGGGDVNVKIGEIQNNNYYLLVGNPYLCSIDMGKFLTKNESKLATTGYWTYENNAVNNPYTNGYIKPLQSFFVKLNSTASEDAVITFTSAMMTDGNNQPAPEPTPALTMTAANDRGQSTATLSVGEETKSVETLFDSNLEDVPMVYTVADGQAVSLQQLTELNKPIAFGVTCAASDELVEVMFTDVAQLTNGNVYVVDAVTGAQTTVGEGSVVAIQPNDYGRYFLLAGMTTIGDRVDVQKGIIISVRDREVTITSGEELTQVHALSLTGATVYQDAARSTTSSFSLSSGVYIIKAENKAGEQQTVKVIVK